MGYKIISFHLLKIVVIVKTNHIIVNNIKEVVTHEYLNLNILLYPSLTSITDIERTP